MAHTRREYNQATVATAIKEWKSDMLSSGEMHLPFPSHPLFPSRERVDMHTPACDVIVLA